MSALPALDAIISVDESGAIVEFNPAAEKIFGYPREKAVGMGFAHLIAPESLPLLRLQAGGRNGQKHEIVALRRYGVEFPAEIAISRVQREGAGLFTAWLRDLTERPRLLE